MQTINATYPATNQVERPVHVGVVGSGDLEILLAPIESHADRPDELKVRVRTSVDGFDTVWRRVLDHFFENNRPVCTIEINDFGATPGMVTLRLSQALELATATDDDQMVGSADGSKSTGELPFTEMSARQRAASLLDSGTFREILGPSYHAESPHLESQGIVPSSDDGCVIARGTINGAPAAVVGLEGKFQGGGIGEISGAKIAATLERALVDAESGHPVRVVLLLETGGIRLQEANLGLLAIAEIHAAIVALQRHIPVTAVISGMVGCFGGMGIAAGLCDHIVMTRAGRLALNGPEVIETEAGVDEFDSTDRSLVWAVTGGEQRVAAGRADVLAEDRPEAIRKAVIDLDTAPFSVHRGDRVTELAAQLADLDPAARPTPSELRTIDGRTH